MTRMDKYLRIGIAVALFLFIILGPRTPRLAQAAPESGTASNNYAIIVGIDSYEDQDIPPLRCAVNDARSMSEHLQKNMGFNEGNIFLLTSDQKGKGAPKRGNIAFALGSIAESKKPGGTFIFYYSGHGMNLEGENYLLTYEADPRNKASLEETALKVSRVKSYIENMCADRVLIIVDACRTDPGGKKSGDRNLLTDEFAKSLIIKAHARDEGSLPQFEAAATIFSCGRGQSSYEWTEKNRGFFTYFLLRGLEGGAADRDGKVTLNSLEAYLSKNVRDTVKLQRARDQVPWIERSGANPGAWTLAMTNAAMQQPAESNGQGDGLKLLEQLNRMIAARPENLINYKYRGIYFLATGDFDKALADFNTIIARRPAYAEAYRMRGILWFNRNDLARAAEDLSRALSLNPGSFIAHYERGNVYFDLKDYERAIADFTKALALIPDDLRCLHNRATAYSEKREYDRAIADCDEALSINPDFGPSYYMRGYCRVMSKEPDKALGDFSKTISLGSPHYDVYYMRAYVYLQQGEREKARADLKKFIDMAPKNDAKHLKDAQATLEKLEKK
jgi:tetratricopeptide (TPR) repeat protein